MFRFDKICVILIRRLYSLTSVVCQPSSSLPHWPTHVNSVHFVGVTRTFCQIKCGFFYLRKKDSRALCGNLKLQSLTNLLLGIFFGPFWGFRILQIVLIFFLQFFFFASIWKFEMFNQSILNQHWVAHVNLKWELCSQRRMFSYIYPPSAGSVVHFTMILTSCLCSSPFHLWRLRDAPSEVWLRYFISP